MKNTAPTLEKSMFATLIDYNGRMIRSSWFNNRQSALEYANRHPGIVAVEEIGKGIVWER